MFCFCKRSPRGTWPIVFSWIIRRYFSCTWIRRNVKEHFSGVFITCIGKTKQTSSRRLLHKQLMMFINFYKKSNNISLSTFNSQATLCCLSGIQAPPKNAEVLKHVAGNEYFVFFKNPVLKYWIYFRVKLSLFSFLKVLSSTSYFSFELEDYTTRKSNIKHVGMSTATGKVSKIILRRIIGLTL